MSGPGRFGANLYITKFGREPQIDHEIDYLAVHPSAFSRLALEKVERGGGPPLITDDQHDNLQRGEAV